VFQNPLQHCGVVHADRQLRFERLRLKANEVEEPLIQQAAPMR
jgi:hypothetical protein